MENDSVKLKIGKSKSTLFTILSFVLVVWGPVAYFIPWNLERFGDSGFGLAMFIFWSILVLPVLGVVILSILLFLRMKSIFYRLLLILINLSTILIFIFLFFRWLW